VASRPIYILFVFCGVSGGSRGEGARGHAPKLMTILRKAARVAVVVTQCFDDDVGTWK